MQKYNHGLTLESFTDIKTTQVVDIHGTKICLKVQIGFSVSW